MFFKEGVEILTEVPAGTLAQLCMWQLVVGQKLRKSPLFMVTLVSKYTGPLTIQNFSSYNLREIEAREDFNKQLSAGDDNLDS